MVAFFFTYTVRIVSSQQRNLSLSERDVMLVTFIFIIVAVVTISLPNRCIKIC